MNAQTATLIAAAVAATASVASLVVGSWLTFDRDRRQALLRKEIDRLFAVEERTLKYEEVYLHAYDTVSAATAGIDHYLTLYNSRRPHSSLADRTPDEAYFRPLPLTRAA